LEALASGARKVSRDARTPGGKALARADVPANDMKDIQAAMHAFQATSQSVTLEGRTLQLVKEKVLSTEEAKKAARRAVQEKQKEELRKYTPEYISQNLWPDNLRAEIERGALTPETAYLPGTRPPTNLKQYIDIIRTFRAEPRHDTLLYTEVPDNVAQGHAVREVDTQLAILSLLNMHKGELRLVQGDWVRMHGPLPTHGQATSELWRFRDTRDSHKLRGKPDSAAASGADTGKGGPGKKARVVVTTDDSSAGSSAARATAARATGPDADEDADPDETANMLPPINQVLGTTGSGRSRRGRWPRCSRTTNTRTAPKTSTATSCPCRS
jgi:hypothetical protein